MQRQKVLNGVLIGLLAAIVILGAALVLTVPAEMKDLARTRTERMFSERGFDKTPEAGTPSREPRFPQRGYDRFRGGPAYHRHGHFLPLAGIVLILLAAGGLAFRRYVPVRRRMTDRTAVEILREKYASGEISKEDYASRKRILDNETESE